MTKIKRITNFITGAAIVLVGILLFVHPSWGIRFAAAVFSLTMTIRGFQALGYYFMTARSMVGGKRILFQGLIYLDLGILTSTMVNNQDLYIILYLVAIHIFNGAIDIMRAREAKGVGAASWKYTLAAGIAQVLAAVAVVISILVFKSTVTASLIYAAGLIYTGAVRIASSFKRTAIVYIQ